VVSSIVLQTSLVDRRRRDIAAARRIELHRVACDHASLHRDCANLGE
jgi:hypothetical protein